MSLSKGYPYTTGEKVNYYFNKIFCFGTQLIGVGIFSRFFLWKQPYYTDKLINEQTSDKLSTLIKETSAKRRWHYNMIMVNMAITGPILYGLYHYGYLSKKYLSMVAEGISVIALGHIYSILAHTYNGIRFQNQTNKIKYGIIETNLGNDIPKEKLEWIMFQYGETNSSEPTYAVYNAYYTNLLFFFESRETALECMCQLRKLTVEKIDLMNENAATIKMLQREFIRHYRIEDYQISNINNYTMDECGTNI